MASYQSDLESAVMQTLVPQLEAEGFRVFTHPSKSMLPAFLSNFQPDAIAFKGDRKLAIEITPAGSDPSAKVGRLQKLFSVHPDWEFRIVYAPPQDLEEVIPAVSRKVIEQHLNLIQSAFDTMGPAAALLTAWAVFEAAARFQLPTNLGKPQAPARLLETLASGGYITPDEADKLRELSKIRNEVAHGRLDLVPTKGQIETLIQIARAILTIQG